ncbi:MAG: hypothetical protein JSV44_09395 [Candidatus Zixiibacteriota bacterium]|nr:MAG: hypothetical protein JSV44_09395 [candidate division Zixibacteria bacterium]
MRFPQVDLNGITTVSLEKRDSKVAVNLLGRPCSAGDAAGFFEKLPKFLKAAELNEFIGLVVRARKRDLPFHVMMGAHVIKVGLSPIIIDLIKKRIVTGLSLNGAGLIHDLELSFAGKTSEDVLAGLADGSFGMSKKTGQLFAEVTTLADQMEIGLGEAAGDFIATAGAPHAGLSLFAAARKYAVPITVHVGIGTDIVHQMNTFDPGATAKASYRDFKILSRLLIEADRGGVVANVGSAVVLPEVFLKALTVARNLKRRKRNIITADFDMISHYRPVVNVVKRPTADGGRGFYFTGHHEIMIPLLAWGLKTYITKIQ